MSVTGKVKFFNETKGYLSVASCNSGTSAPTNGPGSAAFPGECWANTSTSLWQFFYTPDGTNWVEFGTLDTVALKWTPYLGGSPIAASSPVIYSVNAGLVTISCPTCLTAQNIPLGQKVGGLGVSPGGLLYAGSFGSQSMATPFGIGQVPLSSGKNAPSWSQWTVPSSVQAGNLFYAAQNNILAPLALPSCANDGAHALVFAAAALVCETIPVAGAISTSAVLGNFSGSSAAPSAQSVPSCATDGNHALTNNSGSGFNCQGNIASLANTNQVLSGGATVTPFNPPAGNVTVNCGNAPEQWQQNTGAFTVTAPTSASSNCALRVVNMSGAGAVTLSNFSGKSPGGSFSTSSTSSATVTFANGSANITWTANGLALNAIVYFTTTGALPTNFAANTPYFVVSTGTNIIQVSATPGGSAITAGSAGSGTQTGVQPSVFDLVMLQTYGPVYASWVQVQ